MSESAMKARVLVPLGPGFEEVEAFMPVDLLRRAGAQVVTASVGVNPIVGRNRIRVMADIDLSEALAEWGEAWDLVILPGGLGGVEAMEAQPDLCALIRQRLVDHRPVAAICAAPRMLLGLGLDASRPITNHPGCRADLASCSDYREEPVVVDGTVITSRGPGTALGFALACIELLFGAEKREFIARQVVAD